MVDANGSSWHESNRGVSMYLAVYMCLFFIVMLLAKVLHDRPIVASFVPEAAMIILVGMVSGCVFHLVAGNGYFGVGSDSDSGGADAAYYYGDAGDNAYAYADDGNSMAESFLSFSPTVFFVVLLPPIIFNSGYHLRRDLFFRHIIPICLFACVGTALAGIVFASFLYAARFLYAGSGGFAPSFLELLAFGALISATDPVSTLAVFQAKQVDPHLFYLVFGESVINDAVGLVLFEALAHLVEKFADQPTDLGAEFAQFLFDFLLGFVGSMCLGMITGLVAGWFFKTVDLRHTPLLELCLYVPIMYMPFVLAEVAHFSGIVTVLFAGITAKRYIEPNLSLKTADNATTIFRLVAHVNETIIFLELGLSVFGLNAQYFHWGFILMSLVGCLISRALNIYPMTFLYNHSCGRRRQSSSNNNIAAAAAALATTTTTTMEDDGNVDLSSSSKPKQVTLDTENGKETSLQKIDDSQIPMKTAHMLFFSGLRGAVSYALVRTFPQTGNELGFTVTCMVIVLLTTFVLGGTTELALQYLDIPMGVDEKVYLKSLDRRYFLKGPLRRFEAYTLRRWVIRDFEKKSEEEAYMDDGGYGDDDEMLQYVEHIEMTERDHMETVEKQSKMQSLYDFGNHY